MAIRTIALRAGPVLLTWLGLAALLTLIQLGREAPTIFPDEFIYGRLAQNIAAGQGLTLNGLDAGYRPQYPWIVAPAWVVLDGVAAYRVALAFNALAMTSVVVPTFVLARRIVAPRWALATAAGAALVPSMVWAGMLMTEAIAYPLAALTLLAMVQLIRRPGALWMLLVLLVAGLATLIRAQMIVLPTILVLAVAIDLVRAGSGWRARVRDYGIALPGLAVVGIGGLMILYARREALLGSQACVISGALPRPAEILPPLLDYAATLAIATLFVPFIALCALVLRRESWRDAELGPLLVVALAAAAGLCAEASWFAVTGDDIVSERYVFYAAPVMLPLVPALIGRVRPAPILVSTALLVGFLALWYTGLGDLTGGKVARRLGLTGVLADIIGSPGVPWALAAAVLGAAAALAVGLARTDTDRRLLLLVVPMLAFGVAVLGLRQYDANRQSTLLVQRYGTPKDFVDRQSSGQSAGVIALPGTPAEAMFHTQLWNRSVDRQFRVGVGARGIGTECLINRDHADRAVLDPEGCASDVLPRFLVVPPSDFDVRLESARVLTRFTHGPTLYEVNGAPRVLGLGPDIPRRTPRTVTVDVGAQRCSTS